MTRRVVWAIDAQQDIHAVARFLAERDPDYAARVVEEIHDAAASLATYDTGRPGRTPGTQEKSLLRRRLVMSYRMDSVAGEEVVFILHVIHTSRDWRSDRPPSP